MATILLILNQQTFFYDLVEGAATSPAAPGVPIVTNSDGTLDPSFFSAGAAAGFENLLSGTNTSALMVVGSGANLTFSGSGIINANKIYGVQISSTPPSSGQVLVATSSTAAAWANMGDSVQTFTASGGTVAAGGTNFKTLVKISVGASGNAPIQLPDATLYQGQTIKAILTATTGGGASLNPVAGQFIGAAFSMTSYVLTNQGQCVVLESDGSTTWQIVGLAN
jgi:hypothetical protein